ncbi:MAG: AI-2E family transporter [Pseudomonadales bacterium]|nr:AI-2E family transporter [Pseudomonadales bacterium]
MFEVVRGWVNRFLSEEEAVLLAAILIVSTVVILSMGDILAPLLTGIVLAYVMQGTIKFLMRLQVPKSASVLLTFLLFMGGFVALLFFVIPRVWRQMRALFDNLPEMIDRSHELLATLPAAYPSLVSEPQVNSWIDMLNSEASEIGQWLLSFSLSQLPFVVSLAVYIMLVPILVFFLLKDQDEIMAWWMSFLPSRRPLLNQIGEEMNQQMANYIRGKVIEIIIVGLGSYVFFKIMGLDYAALLAFLVGLSVIVPYVGFVAVTFPVVVIAYLQFGWGSEFLTIMFGYFVIQGIDGMVIVPLLFSEAVNLHPIAIITAVLVFGSWWGLWGVFFAIPLATLVKAVMTSWPQVPGPADGRL